MGSDTNTGPPGWEAASWNARRMIVPISSGRRTSCTHFDTAPGDADQVARQQRVVDDVVVVLLAGGDHQRRPVGLGVGEVADGVAEPGGGVQVEEGGAPGHRA